MNLRRVGHPVLCCLVAVLYSCGNPSVPTKNSSPSSSEKSKMKNDPDPKELFIEALKARGIHVKSEIAPGVYRVDIKGEEKDISSVNVIRDFQRDHDKGAFDRFAATISRVIGELPPWAEAKERIRLSAEPA